LAHMTAKQKSLQQTTLPACVHLCCGIAR
jgi:hypothetical protein